MKVLSIHHLFFKLPDDFEGGFVEGLRVMADYHEKPEVLQRQRREPPVDSSMSWQQALDKIWHFFLDEVKKGNRLCGGVSLARIEGNKTFPLDVNTGRPKA